MQRERDWVLYSALMNIIGIILSMVNGILNDNGGNAIGYIFAGLGITGLLTTSILLIGLLLDGRKLLESGSKIFYTIVLVVVSIIEMSLIRVLAVW